MDNIKITSGKVTFSDPCYGLGTWCQAHGVIFPNGEYRPDYKMTDDNDWGRRVAEIMIYNIEKVPNGQNLEEKISWKEIDTEIGVDSGQAGIFDSVYYEKYHTDEKEYEHVDNDWYDKVCNLTLDHEEDCVGVIDKQGLVSQSGYGDGGYIAYIGKLNDEVVAAKIVYIDDNEEEPEDEDWTDIPDEYEEEEEE